MTIKEKKRNRPDYTEPKILLLDNLHNVPQT